MMSKTPSIKEKELARATSFLTPNKKRDRPISMILPSSASKVVKGATTKIKPSTPLSAAAKKLDVRKTFKIDKENVPANPITPITSRKHAASVASKPLAESPTKYQKSEVRTGHVVRVPRKFTRPEATAFISKYIYAYILRKRWRTLSAKWRASKDSAPDRKRNKTIEELIATERKYVGHLRFAIEKYFNPIKESPKGLSAEEIAAIFPNVPVILGFNDLLLKALDERRKQWPANGLIGDIFLKNIEFFKIYIEYTNCHLALNQLKKIRKNNNSFGNWLLKMKESDPDNYDLSDYLIMPVQRIPRYILLLTEILKNTDSDHADFSNLVKATDRMKDIATILNEKVRESENVTKMIQISTSFVGECPVLKTDTKFVREGHLNVVSSKHPENCWFMLFNDNLVYCKKKQNDNFKFKWECPLSELSISKTHGGDLSFVLTTPHGRMLVTADTAEEKLAWKHEIKKLRKEVEKKRDSFVQGMKNSVELGWSSEEEECTKSRHRRSLSSSDVPELESFQRKHSRSHSVDREEKKRRSSRRLSTRIRDLISDEDLVIVRNETSNAISIETKPTPESTPIKERPAVVDTNVKALKDEEESRVKNAELELVNSRALRESTEWELQEASLHSDELKVQKRRLEKEIDNLTLQWKAAIKLRLKLADENQKIEAATQSFKVKLDELVTNNKDMEQSVRALETEKLKLEIGIQAEENSTTMLAEQEKKLLEEISTYELKVAEEMRKNEEYSKAKHNLQHRCLVLKEQKRAYEMHNADRTSILTGRLEVLKQQFQQSEDQNIELRKEKEAIENEIRQLQYEARDRNVVTKIAREYEEKLEKLKESMQKAVRN